MNALDDLKGQSKLKGMVFKRKMMDPAKLRGLGLFGLSGFGYAYYPYVAAHIGQTATTTALTLAALAGMNIIAQRDPIVNTISFVNDGDHAGKI